MATKKSEPVTAMLVIGTKREAVAEVRGAINDILQSGAEQETLRAALSALSTTCEVKSATVTNCSFTSGE